MQITAVVPMKLNNRRLPSKNIRHLGFGRPLCSYILSTLSQIDGIKVYVYCSSKEIIRYIPDEVEFLQRDERLDQDSTVMNEILQEFAHEVPSDIYVLCHTTSPFVKKSSIEKGIYAVLHQGYDSAFSAEKIQDFFWKDHNAWNYELDHIPRTQDLEVLWKETSGFYIYKRDIIMKYGRRIGFHPYIVEVDRAEAMDIDEMIDFEIASAWHDYIMRRGL